MSTRTTRRDGDKVEEIDENSQSQTPLPTTDLEVGLAIRVDTIQH